MKKSNLFVRLVAIFLVAVMTFGLVPVTPVSAALGDVKDGGTGIVGNIDTTDTISLPIEIYDYKADGMLFEFAETTTPKTAADFGATWSADFTAKNNYWTDVSTSEWGNFWSYTSGSINTSNSYANYMRVTYATASTHAAHNWAGNRAGVIAPNDLGGMAMNNARYLVIVYRSNVTSGNIAFFVERTGADRNNTNNRTVNMPFTSLGTTNWTYAVYDLKQGNLANTWNSYGGANGVWMTLPLDASGEYMDIAHIALFADKERAEMFGEYALTDGSDRGDNRAFGLLRGSRNQNQVLDYTGIAEHSTTTTVQQMGWATRENAFAVEDKNPNLGYDLYGTFFGIANMGMLESRLVNGRPVYKEEVVTYLAYLLKDTLEVPERNADGWKNYRYIKGEPSPVYGNVDLATALRTRISGKQLGSYADTKNKNLIGTWAEVSGNITTYHDAAYFLLNNLFVPGSYNEPQSDYNTLVLAGAYDGRLAGNPHTYVFDGGFTATTITSANDNPAAAIEFFKDSQTPDEPADGYIRNTGAASKAEFSISGGDYTTLHPFIPLDGQTKSVYYQDSGVLATTEGKESLVGKNYNYVLRSHGDFVYDPDEDLFFGFEGDDDVYLFINGELVLDIGSAHGIDGYRVHLNDYVDAAWAKVNDGSTDPRDLALALEEGRTYSFDFFYMERHSYGANMRINTNIRLIDPTMHTEKMAWQNGNQLDYGGIIDKDSLIEYGFKLTNTGAERLFNLAFDDGDIGVSLTPENGLVIKDGYNGTRVFDADGGTLEVTDLVVYLNGYVDWDSPKPSTPTQTIVVTFRNNEELKAFLQTMKADMTADGDNAGLWPYSSIEVRGIGYKLTAEQKSKGNFDNKVLTHATNETRSKKLDGDARMRVCIPADPMYYQWAAQPLKVHYKTLVTDVLEAAQIPGNTLEGKVTNLTTENVYSWDITDRFGNLLKDQSSLPVELDSSTMRIYYDKPGSYMFYVKLVYNNQQESVVVPVLINVTDVEDSFFVLDYGLRVNFLENGALTQNDTLTVPGRTTASSILGIGTGGSYADNHISFTKDADGKFREGDAAKGEFTYTAPGSGVKEAFYYLPDGFMDQMETVQVAVNVYETSVTPSALGAQLDINKEVQMYKSVSVLPATVVYYEDNFPGITYYNTDESGISQVENHFTRIETVVDPENYYAQGSQGVDQDQEYGQDDLYKDPINNDDSGRACRVVTITDVNAFAQFQFTGTGFELIARTTAAGPSGNIVMTITDENGNVVKRFPVITKYDSIGEGTQEAIYQVPLIRVEGLAHGKYTVVINGMPAYDFDTPEGNGYKMIPSYFYLDGIRIYHPMGETNEHYNDNENGASFKEIRDLIISGSAAAAFYDGEKLTVGTGTITWTENQQSNNSQDNNAGSSYEGNVVDNVNAYLVFGPNNEVYMNGDLDDAALVFYCTRNEGAAVNNLQIAVRAMDKLQFFGVGKSPEGGIDAVIEYGVRNADGSFAWEPLATVQSSTEQYYSVDLSTCPVDEQGRIQVAIRVRSGMVSFTTIKYNGVTLVAVGGESADLHYQNGMLVDKDGNPVPAERYPDLGMISQQMQSGQTTEPVTASADAEPSVTTQSATPLTEEEKQQRFLSSVQDSIAYAQELANENSNP